MRILLFFFLFTITFLVIDSKCQSIEHSDTLKNQPAKSFDTKLIEPRRVNTDSIIIQETLQGCLSDPVFRREMDVSMIGSLNSPKIGLGFNFSPFIFNKINSNVLFRKGFGSDMIFNSSLETKYLFRKLPIDFRIEYNRFNLSKVNLYDYQRLLIGPYFRAPWTIVGLLVGRDNYQTKENMRYGLFFKYLVHKDLNECCNPYKYYANISSSFYYNTRKKLTYQFKIDCLLNYLISLGIGYENLYDYKQLFITFRYAIFY